MWKHPVFPVHTTEVAPCENSRHAHCQTGVAQVCVWQEVRSWQCQQLGILSCKHCGGVSCHTSSMGERTKLYSSQEKEKTRAVVHMDGLRAQSQVCTQASAKVLGRTERGGAATQEQRVLVPGRGLVRTDVIWIYSQTFKYKPDISICY